MPKSLSSGTVHRIPTDLRAALLSKPGVRDMWEGITPLARNEWICWVQSVKKTETRKQHVDRVPVHLLEGQRRPCCWAGCPHR